MTRARRLSACTVLLLATRVVSPAWSQTAAVDPQTLVGQWSGSWIDRSEEKSNGKYYLKIDKVEGSRVYCAGQFDARSVIPFVATLTGDQLKFVGQANTIELTIRDNQMTGTLTGRLNVRFSLMKEK